jgi:alcohol dehydrogenase YqhD (iron-dependent ADH family)
LFSAPSVIRRRSAHWKAGRSEAKLGYLLAGFPVSHISLPNQRVINVFVDLYEETMEKYDHFSIHENALPQWGITDKEGLLKPSVILPQA